MTAEPRRDGFTIDPATHLGHLALTVASLRRSIDYYERAIGLRLLATSGSSATLGVAERPLLVLDEQQGASPWPRGGRGYTGLYHFALLIPSRTALGQWLAHWLALGLPMPGQGDHLVSEALYLEDPDGHGIEIYRDRPRSEWQWSGGRLRMATDPVDIRGLLEAAELAPGAWSGMPPATTLGHIHLQVRDIGTSGSFYRDLLGFEVMTSMPSALFLAAGGYHHHIGMNVWHSQGMGAAPRGSVRMTYFTVEMPTLAALEAVVDRLANIGAASIHDGHTAAVVDPSGNEIRFEFKPAPPSVTAGY